MSDEEALLGEFCAFLVEQGHDLTAVRWLPGEGEVAVALDAAGRLALVRAFLAERRRGLDVAHRLRRPSPPTR